MLYHLLFLLFYKLNVFNFLDKLENKI